MASYPNTTYDAGASRVTPRESVAVDASDGGTIRGVSTRAAEVYDLKLVHLGLSEAEAATLESFYNTNKVAQIDVTWRSVTYNCQFVSKPDVEPWQGALWSVTSTLVGKRSDGY